MEAIINSTVAIKLHDGNYSIRSHWSLTQNAVNKMTAFCSASLLYGFSVLKVPMLCNDLMGSK